MKLWRKRGEEAPRPSGDDTKRRRMEIVHAQQRLQAVEARAATAAATILHRDARNHWGETIQQIARGKSDR